MLAGVAKQAVPAPGPLEHLRHLELAELTPGMDRSQQGPVLQVARAGQPDRAARVELVAAIDAGGEVHQPTVAVRVAHDPGVAHGAAVPGTVLVFLVTGADRVAGQQVEHQSVTDSAPVMAVVAGGVADALAPALLG